MGRTEYLLSTKYNIYLTYVFVDYIVALLSNTSSIPNYLSVLTGIQILNNLQESPIKT